jgi:hypothetical protein
MHEGNYDDPARKLCCLCQREPKVGTWELCDGCRDALKEKAKRHEAASTVLVCIVCGDRRPSYLPPGFHCARCRARFAKFTTPKR